MKICIELSGYLRTCVAIPTLISKFKGHEIDWYIHTYANDLYVANPIKDFPERKRADIEKIFNYINPIALEIEENSIVLKEINHLLKELRPKDKNDNSESVVSLWRKRLKCSEMRRGFGKKYDLYIVTRPDLYWHAKRYFIPTSSYEFLNKSFIPYEYGYDIVSDVAAIGNESFINYYSSLFNEIRSIYYKNDKDINAHQTLKTYLDGTKYSKIIFGVTVIRPNNNPSPHLGLSGNRSHLSRFLLFSKCQSDIKLNTVLIVILKEILILLKIKKFFLNIKNYIKKSKN